MPGEENIVTVMRERHFVVDRITWWDQLHVSQRSHLNEPDALLTAVFLDVDDLLGVRRYRGRNHIAVSGKLLVFQSRPGQGLSERTSDCAGYRGLRNVD